MKRLPRISFSRPFTATSCSGAKSFDHTRFDDWKNLGLEDAVHKLDEVKCEVHSSVYALLLRKCGAAKDLEAGRQLHLRLVQANREGDRYLANMLVDMYGKCASIVDALSVFRNIPDPNVFSWTMLMAAYAQNGHSSEAIRLYVRMHAEGIRPDKVLFVTVVDACTACGDVKYGRTVHSTILECGNLVSNNLIVANALVNMYGKCGEVGEAERIFQGMPVKDVVSWTAMLVVYAHNCCWSQAFECLYRMEVEGVRPNQVTFVSIVDICAKLRLLEHGRLIHERVLEQGMEPDSILGNALVHMYGNCGSFEDMKSVFNRMSQSNVLLWTTMIAGCAQNGQYAEGLQLFKQMDLEGVKPNEITYMSILDVCRNLDDLKQAQVMDARIAASPFSCSMVLGTSLISLYGKCGVLDRARELLENMRERDVVAWNCLIAACTQNGDGWEAIHLFRRMDMEGYRANKVTYLSMLEACANLEALGQGQVIHERLVHTGLFHSQVALGNSLITMYGKCSRLETATCVFDSMLFKDDVSWNAVMNASVGNAQFQTALELFHRMDLEGERPNDFTLLSVLEACAGLGELRVGRAVHSRVKEGGFVGGMTSNAVKNCIMSMYAKCGSIDEVSMTFDEVEEKSVISWSIMLAAVAQSKQHGRRAFGVLRQMDAQGIKAGEVTLVSALDACATMATLEQGKCMHKRAVDSGYFPASIVVGNTIINMYGRCGSPGDAKLVFDQMPERCSISWNAMIVAFSHNSHAEEAEWVLQEMVLEGLSPDNGTSVSILYGLSHAGLLKQGVEHFKSSIADHGLIPNSSQYKCMVDLLGRKGFLAAAEEVIENMPCEPDGVAWMALLAACKSYGDSQRGVRCAERVLALEPEHAASYVIMSNIYSSLGRWADAARVRKLMQDMNVKKEAGCSWIEVDGNVHEFVSGGSKHPKSRQIYGELECLRREMKRAGYVPDLTAVVHDVDEQEKENILAHHSERLAIACGLVSTPPGSTIRIVKNLRVCSDCHEASKIISRIVGREIVVRDSSRFHHFKQGSCSCKDFW